MNIRVPLLLTALLSSAVVAATPASEQREAKAAAKFDNAVAGKFAGKPQSCISISRANSSQTFGESAIIYRVSQKLLYVNRPRGGCQGLRESSALVTRLTTDRLCSGDIVRVVDFTSGFEGGSCVLGDFTPYTKNPR